MRSRKHASATRLSGASIEIDGRFNEESWQLATPIRDFVQKEPVEGAPPTEEMEVRFLYDENALYVGARMYSRAPSTIQALMGRRDLGDQADRIFVALDTFLDRRTAYVFGVTAAGVRLDRYHPRDDETAFDEGFDPVWEARTNIDAEGWTAELWIPFTQLRFNEQAEVVWGLNIQRITPTLNEEDYWVPVPRTERGWASRFGELRGIEGVRPTRRLEVLPYFASGSTVTPNRDRRNPFDNGRNLTQRAGVDLKMGIGPNLTLEATVNPDFGQVEADAAEVNLSIFETVFPEKRPFFIEGARLLNLQATGLRFGDRFFYSRRIGAAPTGPASADYVDYPRTTTILGAMKLTGRLASGTSLGVLAAVTDEESARLSNLELPAITNVTVAPRTGFAVGRVQQEFGPSGSTASVMMTGMHRALAPGDPLASLLTRNALTLAGDTNLRFKGGEYELSVGGAFTRVDGDRAAIEQVQLSSRHYGQRPDRTYARLDPTRTSLPGYEVAAAFERTGGQHWIWNARFDRQSPGIESNDLGLLRGGDSFQGSGDIRYRETTPGRVFRSYSIGIDQRTEFNSAWQRQSNRTRLNLSATWHNFWTTTFASGPVFTNLDQLLTRGGPLTQTPSGWTSNATVRSRPAATTSWNANVTWTTDDAGGRRYLATGGVSVRPKPRWQFSLDPTYDKQTDSQQYVTALGDGPVATFGQRYVFSYIDRRTYSTQLRLAYTFKPDVNLDVYMEPFAASGRYYGFGELVAARSGERRRYGTDGTTITPLPDGGNLIGDGDVTFTLRNRDFNVRSLRSSVVLRWEWRPGSTFYAVWQQDRNASDAIGAPISLGDVFRSFAAPGTNFLVIKASFWLPAG